MLSCHFLWDDFLLLNFNHGVCQPQQPEGIVPGVPNFLSLALEKLLKARLTGLASSKSNPSLPILSCLSLADWNLGCLLFFALSYGEYGQVP